MTLDAEDGETTTFRKVGIYSAYDTASYPININNHFFCRPAKENYNGRSQVRNSRTEDLKMTVALRTADILLYLLTKVSITPLTFQPFPYQTLSF